MKQYIKYSLVILLCYLIPFGLFHACNRADASTSNYVDDQERRIKLINQTIIGGTTFYILNIDGREYVAQYGGGITPLIK